MPAKSVSIVIASIVGEPFLDGCLKSIETQAAENGAETIVVLFGTEKDAQRIVNKFRWVRAIHRTQRESVPELRRHGLEAASGEVVALIEEHCEAAPGWLRSAIDAHANGDCGAAGGPVADSGYRRLRDWVVYFVEYNGYFPPWAAGDAHDLGSANIAYSRRVLLKYKDTLGAGYWEAALHARMAADGVAFRAAPKMIVRHCGPFNYGYYLQQRYWFSRAFAGARAMPGAKKLAYIALSPLVPFLLLARMASRVSRTRSHMPKFIRALPLLLPALFVFVAGECVGYAAGPGDALLKVE